MTRTLSRALLTVNPISTAQWLASRLEPFDFLLFVYFAAFVREYFWIVHRNSLAWLLTIVVTLVLAGIYLASKKRTPEKTGRAFWLIVALPLLLVYILRVGYPDLSYDVLNYHIFHSERALRGLLNIPGDFAPAYFPYFNNPIADIVTGIFRYGLGFRLGTIVNYLALVWSGSILFKFFHNDIDDAKWRSIAVLLVLFSEQLLSEVNNYMVDLLALPLLLAATQLALQWQATNQTARRVAISLLLGASIALKLTNLVFAVPIGLLVLYRSIFSHRGDLWRSLPLMFVAIVLPIFPHAFYLYRTTGNPVFPLYNKLFQSPYWVNENPFDGRWGPRGAIDTLLWPFRILLRHERLTELSVYSGRMTIGVCAALLLVLIVKDGRARAVGFVTLVSAFLWSLGTGYIRYGLFLELLSGICLVLVGTTFLKNKSRAKLGSALAMFAWIALLVQSIVAAVYTYQIEWGGRPTIVEQPRGYRTEFTQLLRDRSLNSYLSKDELDLFANVGVWVESSYKTSAITGVLRPDLPYLNLFNEAVVSTPAAIQKFRAALKTVEGRKMLSVTFEDDRQMALERLQKRGFAVTRATSILFPYYSFERRLPLVIFEVVPDPGAKRQGLFSAGLVLVTEPPALRAGQQAVVTVQVRNDSGKIWLSQDAADGTRRVALGNKWLDESGRIVINDDGRTPLPANLAPGEVTKLQLLIRAPSRPGKYTLMIDLVQEHVAWFFEKGSTPAELNVTVER